MVKHEQSRYERSARDHAGRDYQPRFLGRYRVWIDAMDVLALLWAKVWRWVVAAGALLAVVATIFLKGRSAGVKTMQAKVDTANDSAASAAVNTQALESRHETDVAVQKLPDAPIQPVDTAAPGTAAGELRDAGFTRD